MKYHVSTEEMPSEFRKRFDDARTLPWQQGPVLQGKHAEVVRHLQLFLLFVHAVLGVHLIAACADHHRQGGGHPKTAQREPANAPAPPPCNV